MAKAPLVAHSREPRTASFVVAVQRELERMIAAGELRGGDRVNESALALKLGMSRGPIREACRTLEQTGVLRSELNRGFFVREITLRQALDIYDVRSKLSGMAGRLAAQNATKAQLRELESLVDRMDAALAADDLGAYYPLNVEFHTRLIASAGNHKLDQLWPTLESELHLFRRQGLVMPGSMRASNHEHRRIVAALKKGDGDAAERLVAEHILAGKARLLRSIDS
jgi:DNA-binding GntR family transcriptional regulator